MTSSAQLERQAEQQRAQIANTLNELRSRMTPGQIVDQISDYVSEGSGGAFLRNLRAQCIANPVPVTVVGAGLAWLMLSGFREPRHRGSSPLRDAPRDTSDTASRAKSGAKSRLGTASDEFSRSAAQAGDRTRRAARQLGEGIKQEASDLTDDAVDYAGDATRAARELRDSVSGATKSGYHKAAASYDRMAGSISDAYGLAAEQAHEVADSIGDAASDMRDSLASAGNGIARIVREQPLVLAGLGLAIGSLLGAYLPTTELEDKLMGDASDRLKKEVRYSAGETLDKGKAVAERAWHEGREEASDQGLLPLNQDASKTDGKTKSTTAAEASLVPQGQEGGEPILGGA